MRWDGVGRRTATLMYAGSDRRSAMRRMAPLTRIASAYAGWHRSHGDLPCCGGVPAHGGGLAHLPAGEFASWVEWLISGGHLAPQEAGKRSRDRGGDDLVRRLSCSETTELSAGSRDGAARATRARRSREITAPDASSSAVQLPVGVDRPRPTRRAGSGDGCCRPW